MANYKEEQIRNNRRLARQIIGGVALLLAFIGLMTVFGWIFGALRTVLDNTDERKQYEDRLWGLVMMDTLPFTDVANVDQGIFKQAAIWGTVYQVQNSGGSLDQYERDPDTGSVMIPKLEIDTYIANLLGPDYVVEDGTFTTSEFVYQYNEEKQCYLVPVTGSVAQYNPQVEKLHKADGKLYVTVGYVPTAANNNSGELSLATPTEPTKYMDFVFVRGANRTWYLSALQESDMKVESTPTPTPAGDTAISATADDQLLDLEPGAAPEESIPEEAAPAEDTPTEDAPAEEAQAEESGDDAAENTDGEGVG